MIFILLKGKSATVLEYYQSEMVTSSIKSLQERELPHALSYSQHKLWISSISISYPMLQSGGKKDKAHQQNKENCHEL